MPTKRPLYTAKPIDRRFEYAPAIVCVRAGLMFISGMVGWNETGDVPEPHDLSAQARRAFSNLGDILAEAGATFDDIVMETEYVVDMRRYREVGLVRREFFGQSRPAATVVEVRRLFRPELLFEI